MSELHKFIFDGLPVRGQLVRLTDAWQDILRRRAGNSLTGPYPAPVRELLGQMSAAALLLQSNITFNGALVLQIFGDGPVKLAVAEVQPDYGLRATASLVGAVDGSASLRELVNLHGQGRCAITLDPRQRQPGQQPYQGVVPLSDADGQPLADLSAMLGHYMRQSEQLETTLVLAADEQVAAGLLIQRLPIEGEANLAGRGLGASAEEQAEHYRRIALLAHSLKREELLSLDADTILRRLFWDEPLLRFEPILGSAEAGTGPRFACTCSRERVANMLRGLGEAEVRAVLAEQGRVEVGCDFCGQQYHFDAIDAAGLFTPGARQPPGSSSVQ